ncbi:MAG: hypothetical protein AB3P11_03360 [Wolbachia pipientis]
MFGNFTKFKDKFNAQEESVDNQSIQYGAESLIDCMESCTKKYDSHKIGLIQRCNKKCFERHMAPEKFESSEDHSQESALIDVSNTLRDIGEGFHILADSFSML